MYGPENFGQKVGQKGLIRIMVWSVCGQSTVMMIKPSTASEASEFDSTFSLKPWAWGNCSKRETLEK